MSRRLFALALLPLAPTLAYAAACGDPSHTFLGRPYDELRECVGSTAALDVVEGEQPAECSPRCLARPMPDGGRLIYLSSMCGATPIPFDASGSDPLCPSALDAIGRRDTCLSDGGSANPAPRPIDAALD